jgi:hypothetical protein
VLSLRLKLAKTFRVVTLRQEHFLEAWLTKRLVVHGGILAQAKNRLALQASEALLVEDLIISGGALVEVHCLVADGAHFSFDVHGDRFLW